MCITIMSVHVVRSATIREIKIREKVWRSQFVQYKSLENNQLYGNYNFSPRMVSLKWVQLWMKSNEIGIGAKFCFTLHYDARS